MLFTFKLISLMVMWRMSLYGRKHGNMLSVALRMRYSALCVIRLNVVEVILSFVVIFLVGISVYDYTCMCVCVCLFVYVLLCVCFV